MNPALRFELQVSSKVDLIIELLSELIKIIRIVF